MSEDYSFLTNLITEDIYYIPPKRHQSPEEKTVMAVTEDRDMEAVDKNDIKNIKYAGQNLKGILVLVNERNQQFLSRQNEDFLKKVLLAINIDLDDIALVNLAGMDEAQMEAIKTFPHRLRFCFMEKIPDILMETELKLYENSMHDGNKILWCDPLGPISNNKELKIKLWQQLKLIFNK